MVFCDHGFMADGLDLGTSSLLLFVFGSVAVESRVQIEQRESNVVSLDLLQLSSE